MALTVLRELLLPSTDTGVLVQGIALVVLVAVALRLTWQRQEWRLVTIGTALVLAGLFGLRAAH